jgi:hypothetical protein
LIFTIRRTGRCVISVAMEAGYFVALGTFGYGSTYRTAERNRTMAAVSTVDIVTEIVAGDVARLRRLLPPTGDPAEDGAPDMPEGVTPLMVAAACGQEAAVELLLQTGSDPARRDAHGRTAAA